jgi:hypothetical protein
MGVLKMGKSKLKCGNRKAYLFYLSCSHPVTTAFAKCGSDDQFNVEFGTHAIDH